MIQQKEITLFFLAAWLMNLQLETLHTLFLQVLKALKQKIVTLDLTLTGLQKIAQQVVMIKSLSILLTQWTSL